MATALEQTTLIPIRDSAVGPVTAKRTHTTLSIYAAVAAIGFIPTLMGMHGHWQAVGLGLAVPGGGCLHYRHLGMFAGGFVSFLFSLILWFGTANALAPPIVGWRRSEWSFTTIAQETPHGAWVALGFVLLPFVAITIIRQIDLVRGRAVAKQRNEYLAKPDQVVSVPATTTEPREELSEEDLAVARYSLNRALQPIDEFNGFSSSTRSSSQRSGIS
ncbi:MAG: hypothetical protein CMJ78_01585 [Planctomycetaceae bacterium]|nr:hypothetical protein [Planctomycetaceae bacterium]